MRLSLYVWYFGKATVSARYHIGSFFTRSVWCVSTSWFKKGCVIVIGQMYSGIVVLTSIYRVYIVLIFVPKSSVTREESSRDRNCSKFLSDH